MNACRLCQSSRVRSVGCGRVPGRVARTCRDARSFAFPVAETANLGDAINYIADGLASVTPGPLAPIVDTLGADIANVINLQPSFESVGRLVVRS